MKLANPDGIPGSDIFLNVVRVCRIQLEYLQLFLQILATPSRRTNCLSLLDARHQMVWFCSCLKFPTSGGKHRFSVLQLTVGLLLAVQTGVSSSKGFVTLTVEQSVSRYLMLRSFFWVIPRRLNFTCWRFETLCLFHLHRSFKQGEFLWLKRRLKRQHIKFGSRRITRKKEHDIHSATELWNEEGTGCCHRGVGVIVVAGCLGGGGPGSKIWPAGGLSWSKAGPVLNPFRQISG